MMRTGSGATGILCESLRSASATVGEPRMARTRGGKSKEEEVPAAAKDKQEEEA